MIITQTNHWDRRTIRHLEPVLAQAKKLIRIATGFFTIEGYDLVRKNLIGKQIRLMVGYDEASKERLREKLIDDIMLHLRTWNDANRRAAVSDLVEQLQKGQFRIVEQQRADLVDARLRHKDHGKIYIIDEDYVAVGSSNLTVSGLLYNIEGVHIITETSDVVYWCRQFDHYWNAHDTIDLTQALLDALLAWLKLHPPYDVYLKTISALIPEDNTPPPREDYKLPVRYQMIVIERVLRQLKDWGGAMLVASTGLGKTIMATHIAYRLRLEHQIYNVIVFAPLQVHEEWQRALRSAGLEPQVFTRDLLDQPLHKKNRKVRQIVEALQNADRKYIIFVDESHHFKNMLRAKDGKPRHSFSRLFDAVNSKGAKIVLLTATPLAKGVDNLNNQLYLLPHKAPTSYLTSKGQQVIPGIRDAEIHPNAWKIQEKEGFFEDFINLPVATVISTSQVAKDFAEHESRGDYVLFGETRKWIPRIEIQKIKAPVPLEGLVSQAIQEKYFKHKMFSFQQRGIWLRSETTIQNEVELSWASSPAALQEVIQKTLEGSYEVQFIRRSEDQAAILGPILERLRQITYQQDEKFWALVKYLKEAYENGRKVVIFTERHATAVYLEEALTKEIPKLSIANVSRRTSAGYELKDFDKEVRVLLSGFAPEANSKAYRDLDYPKQYDILITTDAYSAGVNLQDASVVISYDLAWTPDIIIQRAGRVLRFWKEPRLVSLYVFVSYFREDVNGQSQTAGIEKRLRTLTIRSQQAQQFSELPVFPESDSLTYGSLGDLSTVTIEDLGLADITQIEEFTGVSGYLRHITELKQNLDYASKIPDDISSAMTHNGEQHLLYLLLRYKQAYYWTMYDIQHDRIFKIQEDSLLNLIRCARETEVANVNAGVIELHAQKCRTLWLEENTGFDPMLVERICALYLLPYWYSGDLGQIFLSSVNEPVKAIK
jgi:superfamily II DNA or RNA helicase